MRDVVEPRFCRLQVRFCDTIPAVLARLIKSASCCRASAGRNVRAVPEAFVLRQQAQQGRPVFATEILSAHGIINTIRTCSPLAYRRCAAPAAETRHTTNPPAHKGREAADDDAPDILIDHLVERGKALRRFACRPKTRLFNALASGSQALIRRLKRGRQTGFPHRRPGKGDRVVLS